MLEVGIIEHNGQHFAANGATCDGVHLTAYLKETRSRSVLTDWHGRALVALRSIEGGETFTLNVFGDKGETLCLRCGRGRFIGGLSLGNLSLFRGEVFTADDDREALHLANEVARCFAERDYEDSLEPSEIDSE